MKLSKLALVCLAALTTACADRTVAPIIETTAVAPQLSVSAASTGIVITEFLPNPNTNTNDSGEYFEIYNAGCTAVNLGGWTIKSKTGSSVENHVIAGSFIVAPGAYALVTAQWAIGYPGLAVPVTFYETNRSGFSILNSDTNEFIALIHPTLGTVDSVRLGFNAGTQGQPRLLRDVNTNGLPDEDNSLASSTNWTTTAPVFFAGSPTITNSGTPGNGPFNATMVTRAVSIAQSPASVKAGDAVTFTATLAECATTIPTAFTYTSSDPTTIRIDNAATGAATALKAGTASVTATASDAGATSGTIAVTVAAAPVNGTLDITIDDANDVPVGFTKNARVITYKDKNGVNRPFPYTDLIWYARDATIASTDGSYITGIKEGETWIIVEGIDNAKDSTIIRVFPFTDLGPADYTRSNTEFGAPADATPGDDILISRKQFALSYNATRGGPNWVAWVLNGTHLGSEDRCDCFTVEPQLPGAQRIHHRDYTGSGFSRGHMTMSAQRTTTFSENATTFYMSNMLPQMQANNGGPWLAFENYITDLAKTQGKEVYNIAGGIYLPDDSIFAGGRVRAPSWTWKVAVIMPRAKGLADATALDKLEVIAIRTPNHPKTGVPGSIAGIKGDWREYVTTVDEIEAQTGYDLLALLADHLERPIEFNDKAPVAHAGGTYAGVEGAAITFDASASTDADLSRGDQLSYTWTFSDGSTATGKVVSKSFADNGTFTATVRVVDNYGLESSANATVTVGNAAPSLSSVTFPTGPVSAGVPVTLSASYTDAGSADTHVLTVNWGDGTTSTVAASGGAASTTHSYTTAGLYAITLSLADDDGATATAANNPLPIFDTAAGFVTGGGWFNAASAKTNVTFVAKYDAGETTPKGNLELHVNEADFRFTSESFDWLVVSGARATLTGTGSLRGQSGQYRFTMTVSDGDVAGGDKKDRVRIQITDAAGAVVFDNQPGAAVYAAPTVQLMGNLDIKR